MTTALCGPDGLGRCAQHGTPWDQDDGCSTGKVLDEVALKHRDQWRQYGEVNEGMADGTGPDVWWLGPVVDLAQSAYSMGYGAAVIEEVLREEWDYPKDGTPEEQAAAAADCTWMRLLREEVAEAFAEEDWDALDEELTQAAGIIVSWKAALRRRRARVGRDLAQVVGEALPSTPACCVASGVGVCDGHGR
jgi:hypothetical protein